MSMSAQQRQIAHSAENARAAPTLAWQDDHWVAQFVAMSCPCEVLIESAPEAVAREIAYSVAACAWRIEASYSRFLVGNIVHRINNSNGAPLTVDVETANLLVFSARLTELSGGAFDITSGVLRKAWRFDGSDRVPSREQVDAVRKLVGWHKVVWRRPVLRMLPDMQIDFGGIGKEYAVDSAVGIAHSLAPNVSCLVNFGGDMAVRSTRRDGNPWRVGIESCDGTNRAAHRIMLRTGALATSGDSRRFLLKDGVRYSHVLDARTGWPVQNAPHAVTVLAETCTQAGTFATLALLRGTEAESFLREQNVKYWLQ
jgi:thiamine biosynthesis lipoprotein